jgi:hypothetical protein
VDWILKQAEDVAALAWRELVTALDAIGRSVDEILDWAAAQAEATMREVISALDAAGNMVARLVAWAASAGDLALRLVGEVLVRAGHTADNVLLWVEKDALGGLLQIVRGMIAAGATVVDLMAWAASRGVKVVRDVAQALLEAGVTIAQLLADALTHPGNALDDLVAALDQLGKTTKDIVEAAVILPAADATKRAIDALKSLGRTALEVLMAAADMTLSAVALVVTAILEWFPGDYRPLTPSERVEADRVFGTSVDLDKVRVAVKSIPVDVVEYLNGGRAFTTMYLLNFASWIDVKIDTLIHELTHVWQGVQVGPVYMIQALEAQMSGEGYNYGYTDSENGDGGQDDLAVAGGDFGHFNREQQAQIVMHYWARRYRLLIDYAAWQPYADVVHA